VTIRSLSPNLRLRAEPVKSVRVLGADAALKWSVDAEGLHVQVPEKKPCEHAFVLKIE
jgi:alpha-L-fucosidase